MPSGLAPFPSGWEPYDPPPGAVVLRANALLPQLWRGGAGTFKVEQTAGVIAELESARNTFPDHYIKLNAFDSTQGVESLRLSFIVNRPEHEPGFALVREEAAGRAIRYTIRSYAVDRPEGERYR